MSGQVGRAALPSHIVWDWNGTLQDDVQAAVNGINVLLARRGLPLSTLEIHRRHFGFPVRNYYTALGFRLEDEDWDELSQSYYDAFYSDPTPRLFDATMPTLRRLRALGVGMSRVSAAERTVLVSSLKRYGLDALLDNICGLGDRNAQSKLELGRDLVGRLVRDCGFDPRAIWFVGDTNHDYEMAAACGASCLLLTCGYQSEERLAACPCPRVGSIADVLGFFGAE